ncbi:tripartite tricarboxylate transporter TctB family protein [Sedimentitalea sp. XS_ASV28]|uniref:tripartite tricarboxylate transporter TctB family protein n=1 Tax=Sedimentitalea sp. XS_ASV28 TaxID=3241296 RepID=UPI003511C3F0
MDLRLENIIAGGAVLGISAILFTQLLPGQFEGVELARNPMTFPRFLLLIFALGGTFLVLSGLFGSRGPCTAKQPVAWGRVLALFIVTAIYLFAYAPIGFIPVTLVFLPVTILTLGYRRPLVIAIVTLVTVFGLWYVFAEGFSVRPPGIGIDDMLRMFKDAS